MHAVHDDGVIANAQSLKLHVERGPFSKELYTAQYGIIQRIISLWRDGQLHRNPGLAHALRLGEVTFQLLARGGIEASGGPGPYARCLIYTFGYAAFAAARASDPDPTGRIRQAEQAFAANDSLPLTIALAPELARTPT